MAEFTEGDRDTLRQMTERDWVDAALAREWDTSLAMCSDDLVYMPPDNPPLRGKAEARGFFDAFPPILQFTQSVEAISGDAELAVLQCRFALSIEGEDGQVSGEGKVLATASKNSGEWLFTTVCFNWNAPLS